VDCEKKIVIVAVVRVEMMSINIIKESKISKQ